MWTTLMLYVGRCQLGQEGESSQDKQPGEMSSSGQEDRQALSAVTHKTSENEPSACKSLGKGQNEVEMLTNGESLELSWVLSHSWVMQSNGG